MLAINKKIILHIFFIFLFIIFSINTKEILCNRCQSKITEGYSLINIRSTASISSNFKKKFYNNKVLTHTFKNPHNILFEVITVSDAQLLCENMPHEESTFFPGYGWKICVCPVCGNHHGWHFSPILKHCQAEEKDIETCMNKKPFYGLVTNNLISSHSEKIEL